MNEIIGRLVLIFTVVILIIFTVVEFAIGGGGLPLSKVKKLGNVPIYEKKEDLIKSIPDNNSFEQPKDELMRKHLQSFLQSLKVSLVELCDFIDAGRMEMSYWNGMYSTSLWMEEKRIYFRIIFKSEKGEFQQCQKSVYQDKGRKTKIREKGYEILFYDEGDYLEWYHQGDDREILRFYPNNKIKGYSYKLKDNSWYSVRWNEEGKIISEEVKRYSR